MHEPMHEPEPTILVKPIRTLQYDGTNATAIAKKIDDFTIVNETATNLTFRSAGANYTVGRKGHMVFQDGRVTAVFQNDDALNDAWAAVAPACHEHRMVLRTGEPREQTYP